MLTTIKLPLNHISDLEYQKNINRVPHQEYYQNKKLNKKIIKDDHNKKIYPMMIIIMEDQQLILCFM